MLNAGAAQSLSVTFTPTDGTNYTTATKAVPISVTRATPVITWPTPAGIVYGTALSATQLNATASSPRNLRLYARARDSALRRRRAIAVGHLHADRRGELHDRDGQCGNHRAEGDAGDYLEHAGKHHLRHCARRRTVERVSRCAGDVCLYAGCGNGPARRSGAEPVGHVHADRRHQLPQRDGRRADHGHQGDARHHLGDARGYRLRRGARRDAAERDHERPWHLRLHASCRRRPQCRRGAEPVGHVHADRWRQLHECDEVGCHQRHQGDAGHHLGGASGHRLRCDAERDAAERDHERPWHLRLHASCRRRPQCRRGAEPVGHVHADRWRQLHECDEVGCDQRRQGDTGHHLGGASGHRLRCDAEHDAAERDHERLWHLRLHASCRRRPQCRRGAEPVGHVHADRWRQLHECDEVGCHQRHQGDTGHHLGGASGHRLRCDAEHDAAERDHERRLAPSSTRQLPAPSSMPARRRACRSHSRRPMAATTRVRRSRLPSTSPRGHRSSPGRRQRTSSMVRR